VKTKAQIVSSDDNIRAGLLHLEDAICEHERGGHPGYTLILIPRDRRENVHISIDGKPVALSIAFAVELATHERASGGATECSEAPR